MRQPYPPIMPWPLLVALGLFNGFYYWNYPYQVNNSTSILWFICAGAFLLVTVFFCLFRFKKGRALLRKIPIKKLQERACD